MREWKYWRSVISVQYAIVDNVWKGFYDYFILYILTKVTTKVPLTRAIISVVRFFIFGVRPEKYRLIEISGNSIAWLDLFSNVLDKKSRVRNRSCSHPWNIKRMGGEGRGKGVSKLRPFSFHTFSSCICERLRIWINSF